MCIIYVHVHTLYCRAYTKRVFLSESPAPTDWNILFLPSLESVHGIMEQKGKDEEREGKVGGKGEDSAWSPEKTYATPCNIYTCTQVHTHTHGIYFHQLVKVLSSPSAITMVKTADSRSEVNHLHALLRPALSFFNERQSPD